MSVQPIQLRFTARPMTDEKRRMAVETTVSFLNLPQARPLVVRDDAVHVVVAGAEQLSAWMYALGGEMNRAPELDGASLWTLRTKTPARSDGSSTEIRVHAAIVCFEDVLAEVHGPVSA